MSDSVVIHESGSEQQTPEHWTARYLSPLVFIIVALVGAGIYLAFNIPVAVLN
jgi:hypothetical protein